MVASRGSHRREECTCLSALTIFLASAKCSLKVRPPAHPQTVVALREMGVAARMLKTLDASRDDTNWRARPDYWSVAVVSTWRRNEKAPALAEALGC